MPKEKNRDQSHAQDMALRAFDRWTTRGQPVGTHLQDWQEAEADLHQLRLIAQQLTDLQQRLSDMLAEQAQARRRLAPIRNAGWFQSADVTRIMVECKPPPAKRLRLHSDVRPNISR